jgi:hypothetical protein
LNEPISLSERRERAAARHREEAARAEAEAANRVYAAQLSDADWKKFWAGIDRRIFEALAMVANEFEARLGPRLEALEREAKTLASILPRAYGGVEETPMQRETIVEFVERQLREQGRWPSNMSPEALVQLREAIVESYAHYLETIATSVRRAARPRSGTPCSSKATSVKSTHASASAPRNVRKSGAKSRRLRLAAPRSPHAVSLLPSKTGAASGRRSTIALQRR